MKFTYHVFENSEFSDSVNVCENCVNCSMDWKLCELQYGLETVCTVVWIRKCVNCSMDWKLCKLQYGLETVCTVVWIGKCVNCSMDWKLCELQYRLETVWTAVWPGNCVHCSMDWKLCELQYGLENVCTAVWPGNCTLQYGLDALCPAVLLTVNWCMNCFLKLVISNIIFLCTCLSSKRVTMLYQTVLHTSKSLNVHMFRAYSCPLQRTNSVEQKPSWKYSRLTQQDRTR